MVDNLKLIKEIVACEAWYYLKFSRISQVMQVICTGSLRMKVIDVGKLIMIIFDFMISCGTFKIVKDAYELYKIWYNDLFINMTYTVE